MADIELVIKIPEVFYEALRKTDVIISGQRSGKTLTSVIFDAVAKGTPLPRGHGDLKDVDVLTMKLKAWDINVNGIPNYAWKCIRETPTIIEADKQEGKE